MAGFMDSLGLGETGKLNNELKNLAQQRMNMLAQIGQMVYDHKKKGESGEPDLTQLIEAVDSVNANTKAIEDRIAMLKGGMVCPKCGGIVPQGNRFCPHCGGEMPVMQPVQQVGFAPQGQGAPPQMQPAQSTFCASCGAPLQPGIKFCAGCGAATGA